jgi:hypothetical protein
LRNIVRSFDPDTLIVLKVPLHPTGITSSFI